MAFDSYPNTPHNARALTLAEHELLVSGPGLGRTGLYGPPSVVAGTLPAFGDSSGRQVKVRAGVAASVRGTRFINTTDTIVAVTANASGNPRVDLLVLRLDRLTYVVTPTVIAGVPAGSPVAPSPVRNEPGGSPDYWDLPLAEIAVANGAATITSGNVTNKAWWLAPSGYTGSSTARPPVEAGMLWRETDTGITYIGTQTGTLLKVSQVIPYVDIGAQTGWTITTFAYARDGWTCTLSVRILRSGAALSSSTSAVFAAGILPATMLPGRLAWGTYHVSDPSRAGVASVDTDGTITFSRDLTNPINTNAVISAGLTWQAAS